MPRTSKVPLSTDESTSEGVSTSSDVRPPATFPPDRMIEAARSRLRSELCQHNDGVVSDTIEHAVDRAIELHAGQVRKSGEPYVVMQDWEIEICLPWPRQPRPF